MNLKEIRMKARDLSGRYDLVNEDDSDNGMDFFLNEGQRLLDRLGENQKTWASAYKFALADSYVVSFQYCRAIKEIWVSSTTARWQLTKKSYQEILADYLSGDPAELESGTPLYYTPIITRHIPGDITALTIEAFLDFVEVPYGQSPSYNSIMFNIPTDTKLAVEIKGLFYTTELSEDDDFSYWSALHPALLIKAAFREMEVFNQNQSKVEGWEKAIAVEIKGINQDLVDELISEIDEMEG